MEDLLRTDTDAIEEDLIGATILESQQIHARSPMDSRVVGRKIEQGLEFWIGRIAGPDDEGLGFSTGSHPWNRALEGPARGAGVSHYRWSCQVLSAGSQMADPDRDPSTAACVLCKVDCSGGIAGGFDSAQGCVALGQDERIGQRGVCRSTVESKMQSRIGHDRLFVGAQIGESS